MIQSFLKPLYHDVKTLVLDTLFPIYCLVCEKEGQKFICDECQNKLTPLPQQFCIICQKPSVGGITHPKCFTPHTADGLISIFDYHDEQVADILIKGKYSFLPKVYEELGLTIADTIKKNFSYLLAPSTYNLVPVPLHWMRQNWRGFNQAQILSETLAKNLNASCTSVLVRSKFTRTQKDLKKEERTKNINSAFSLKPGADIHNKSIILIDDVTTTGNTLLEATKVLKRNGAEKVFCLTVARD